MKNYENIIANNGYSTGWYNPDGKYMWCYIALVYDESILSHYDRIKENANLPVDWTQIEITFDKDKNLREFHYLVFDGSEDAHDCDLIGEEIKEDGKTIGHTLFSHDEFRYLVDKVYAIFLEEYDSFDWSDVKGGN